MSIPPADRVAAIRAFNRFYTRQIGVVGGGYLQTDLSLTEARVLYELAQTDDLTASQIGTGLGLDAGYLSRLLRRFQQEGWLERHASATDRRQANLSLTEAGRAAFAPLDSGARQAVAAMLTTLPAPEQERLVDAMRTVMTLLSRTRSRDWVARPPSPGDIGWVIQRHAAIYAEEFGFDHRFEALVADVASSFLKDNDPAYERAWIAEQSGVRLGSIFLVRKSPEIAKLRLLLVEPSARGLGVGKGLVEECLTFARAAGYRRVTLWTNEILVAARGIYRAAGFRIIGTEPHSDFGPPMVGEEWELIL